MLSVGGKLPIGPRDQGDFFFSGYKGEVPRDQLLSYRPESELRFDVHGNLCMWGYRIYNAQCKLLKISNYKEIVQQTGGSSFFLLCQSGLFFHF